MKAIVGGMTLLLAASAAAICADPGVSAESALSQLESAAPSAAEELRAPSLKWLTHRFERRFQGILEFAPGLYRSGDPTRPLIGEILTAGIRYILTLDRPTRGELLLPSFIRLERIPDASHGVLAPKYEEIDAALEILMNPSQRPLLVHCEFGRDRTGLVVAAYRIVAQGWTVQAAADEAVRYGCCAPFYPSPLTYLQGYANYRAAESAAAQ